MPPTGETSLPRSTPLVAILVLLAGGIALGAYLTWAKLGVELLPDFQSGCNFGGDLNCDAVAAHPASSVFGLPISLLAIPTYLVMIFLTFRGLGRDGTSAGVAVSYLAGIALLTVAYSVYLLVLTFTEMDAICPFCLGMHGIHIAVLLLAVFARGVGFGGVFREVVGSLSVLRRPALSAAAVLVLTGGGTVLAYDAIRGGMVADQKARVEAQLTAPAADEATGSQAKTDATPAAARAAAETPPAARKPVGKLTDSGYDYFEIPVGPDDYILGNPDAEVTVVVIKDFECGFCRYLGTQLKPLKAKYKDKVRFVFKHYPMNADCNYRMGRSRMHPRACEAAYTAHCAAEQGKFWDMHDLLFTKQKKFSDSELRGYAETVGLDLAAYDSCLASDRPTSRVAEDVKLAARMRINGTPRVYINNRLVTGSTARDVLDYYLKLALEQPSAPAAPAAVAPGPETPPMVKAQKESGPFWIDAFEASIDAGGKALSVAGATPALASWFEAEAACTKAGKRLCTEEEWVSACIGRAATDPDGNTRYTDGPVHGRLYPYGPFYEPGACRDSEDKYKGKAGPTGSMHSCRTPDGIYDLSGNLYEWIGQSAENAAQIGGDWRAKTAATCRRRTTTYGAGIKNQTTGFRCCADAEVGETARASDAVDTTIDEVVGKAVPDDLVLETTDGKVLNRKSFEGKVSYLTFFASWCGNCRKQMPAIKAWETEWASKGFQVVAINVDRQKAKAERYLKTLEPNFTVALDPSARTMSDFDINAMPTSFIVGRDGVIKKRVLGYKDNEIQQTRQTIEGLFDS